MAAADYQSIAGIAAAVEVAIGRGGVGNCQCVVVAGTERNEHIAGHSDVGQADGIGAAAGADADPLLHVADGNCNDIVAGSGI